MKKQTGMMVLTLIWLVLWGLAIVYIGDPLDEKIKNITLITAGYLLAAMLVPIILLWIYLYFSKKREAERKRADEEYMAMIRAQHMSQTLQFEPMQSNTFSGVNGDTYSLELKNVGEEIFNLSFQAPLKSNVKKIYVSSDIEKVKQGDMISLILHLHTGNNQQHIMHENILPENTIFSIKYDTAIKENIIDTFQLEINYHPQNSIVRIIRK